jgi:hypothetical protein
MAEPEGQHVDPSQRAVWQRQVGTMGIHHHANRAGRPRVRQPWRPPAPRPRMVQSRGGFGHHRDENVDARRSASRNASGSKDGPGKCRTAGSVIGSAIPSHCGSRRCAEPYLIAGVTGWLQALSSFRHLVSSRFDILSKRSTRGPTDDRKPMGASDRAARFVRCFFIGLALRGTAYRLGREGGLHQDLG